MSTPRVNLTFTAAIILILKSRLEHGVCLLKPMKTVCRETTVQEAPGPECFTAVELVVQAIQLYYMKTKQRHKKYSVLVLRLKISFLPPYDCAPLENPIHTP